ncbi:NBS-containing resistance-like protein, partial [Trifolium medium]|nr:NBS-containing resistance-like protein [Trifolium medium]
MDPIKYIFEKPALAGKISRWQMLLSEYDIQYVTQKAIKGSVLSEHLAHQPLEEYQPIRFDFPDEDIMVLNNEKVIGDDEGPEPGARWKLAFDGTSNAMGHRIGAVLISPIDGYTPFTARLCFDCTNNMAEYEACIMGLEAAIDLRIKILEV